MNSSTPSTKARSRLSKWGRRLLWSGICLASLLTLYYQWENWRSARELKEAHARLVERIGTDDMWVQAPPSIPDEQNFFALPVVAQWAAEDLKRGSSFKVYRVPKDAFWPEDLPEPKVMKDETDGTSKVDWTGRGTPIDVVALNQALGDANGLLTQLGAGLGRPFACLKPGLREALESAGKDRHDVEIPNIVQIMQSQQKLCLHLRCAAEAGDVARARQTALISLRLFAESAATHGTLIVSMQSLACHSIAFEALQQALGYAVWDEASLRALKLQLAKINDLEMLERSMRANALWGFATAISVRDECARGNADLFKENYQQDAKRWGWRLWHACFTWAYLYGPSGWHDANLAFYLNAELDVHCLAGETMWMSAGDRRDQYKARLKEIFPGDPRRMLGVMGSPNIGNLFSAAARTLFRRRCLIIACVLEKHRLLHGSYPASLEAVQDELKLFAVNDPARPTQMPGYRLEKSGYLLWSAGHDAQDNGGMDDRDWLWRMKLNTTSP
ncbi:hypothetical protein [Prosthecobacter sp.]|uniref:hypothetical protein n=1 Tax=Prosthecobacter sp. TaxID=1965333 RepID=UPI003784E107